jgi:hypothetical protein
MGWAAFHPGDGDLSLGTSDFRRNPSGRGQLSPFRSRSSLRYTRYLSLLTPRTEKNWLPALPTP